jgi:hypothetical protein
MYWGISNDLEKIIKMSSGKNTQKSTYHIILEKYVCAYTYNLNKYLKKLMKNLYCYLFLASGLVGSLYTLICFKFSH